MKCINCKKEFYNPYVNTKYCCLKCEEEKRKENEIPELFKKIFWL